MHIRKILVLGLSIFLIVIFIIYAGIEARGLFYGPKVDLYSPIEGSTLSKPVILVDGQSFRTKELTINGDKILIDTTGKFSVNLVLAPGYNIITIVATDARGAQHTITRHIFMSTESLFGNDAEGKSTTTDNSIEASSTTASTSYSN